jgi:hypothetical protein
MKPIILLGLLVCGAVPAHAQGDSTRILISGRVVDPMQQPLEGVELKRVGSDSIITTRIDGTFRILVRQTGSVLLQVRRIGYLPQLVRFDRDWSGTILLVPGVYRLEDIAVSAHSAKPARYAGTAKYDAVFARRRIGLGELVDRSEVDQCGALQTAQLLEGRAGVRVLLRRSDVAGDEQGAIVSFSRCSELPPKINVYVDGHKQQARMDIASSEASVFARLNTAGSAEAAGRRQDRYIVGELLDRINPSDIEMMEIFRGPSELPAEFNDGNCGAIAIWTRFGR